MPSLIWASAAVSTCGFVYYLDGRAIVMSMNDGKTERHVVVCGVLQGGVLSPILFNVALIGPAEVIPDRVRISTYADDVRIWASRVTRPQIRARLQRVASLASQYLQCVVLQLATDKCAAIVFTRKLMCRYPIIINCNVVPYVM